VADPAARAARRAAEDGTTDAAVTELALARRDEIDSTRAASPLSKAPDAILVDSTYLSLEEVIEAIVEIVDDKT
jgi:cytidylate kinase